MVFDIVSRMESRKRPFSQLATTDLAHVYFDSRQARRLDAARFAMTLPDSLVRNASQYQQLKVDAVGFYNNITNLTEAERSYVMRVWSLDAPETPHIIKGTLPDAVYAAPVEGSVIPPGMVDIIDAFNKNMVAAINDKIGSSYTIS